MSINDGTLPVLSPDHVESHKADKLQQVSCLVYKENSDQNGELAEFLKRFLVFFSVLFVANINWALQVCVSLRFCLAFPDPDKVDGKHPDNDDDDDGEVQCRIEHVTIFPPLYKVDLRVSIGVRMFISASSHHSSSHYADLSGNWPLDNTKLNLQPTDLASCLAS